MLTVHAGHQMDNGWPLFQIVKASFLAKMLKSRRNRAKGEDRYGLSPAMEAKLTN